MGWSAASEATVFEDTHSALAAMFWGKEEGATLTFRSYERMLYSTGTTVKENWLDIEIALDTVAYLETELSTM